MRDPIRFLLTVMLLLALPLQGYAAASMLRCAPSHHGVAQAQSPLHAAHHGHAADAGHAAHHDAGTAGDTDHAHGKYGCSACAACCVGGALTASPSGVAASSQLHERPLPVLQTFAAFITDGPERPPRTVLA